MEVIKSYIEKPHHYAMFFYRKEDMDFVGSYSICDGYLYNVHVVEKRRGVGYGERIVRYAQAEKKELFLDVDPVNEVAIKCYEKCGFVFDKVLYDYHHKCWGEAIPPATKTLRYKFKSIQK